MSQKPQHPHFKIEDYLGKKENLLTVVGIAERLPTDKWWYLDCVCECGNHIRITPSQFNRKVVKSCGCIIKNGTRTIDGRSKHPLYRIWNSMIDRCENPNTKYFEHYGGRGISVCKSWHNFWNFVSWSESIGGRPEGYSIDRINNDGDYCPENCRWANYDTQLNNTSRNIYVTFQGVTKTVKQWADEKNMNHQTLLNRLNRGWGVEKALTTPVHKRIKPKSV